MTLAGEISAFILVERGWELQLIWCVLDLSCSY